MSEFSLFGDDPPAAPSRGESAAPVVDPSAPLAERMRPRTLDEIVGQQHLVGPEGTLRRLMAAGHLPNAINWDWMNGVPTEGWETLRPTGELAAELAAVGITPDKEIVTYCRSGARASHTLMLLRTLGYPRVRNFKGSWLEWSARVLGANHS